MQVRQEYLDSLAKIDEAESVEQLDVKEQMHKGNTSRTRTQAKTSKLS